MTSRYALVSWANGPDKDALSIVPTKWILDFDRTDISRKFLVECRTANAKRPANGWQVEEALVLQLADKESTLKAAEQELLRVDVPEEKKRSRKPKRLFHDDEDEDEDSSTYEIPKKKNLKLAAQRRAEDEILNEDSQLTPRSQSRDSQSTQVTELQGQVKTLQKENARLRNMVVKEIPAMLLEMRKVLSQDKSSKELNISEIQNEDTVTPCKPSGVKLGNDGTITVSSHCWETAKTQNSASGMARVLLMGLFSVDVLLRSNLTGGANKVDPSAERRQALDGEKLQALLDAVVNHHPGAKVSDLRKSLNTRICELRHQVKKKNNY